MSKGTEKTTEVHSPATNTSATLQTTEMYDPKSLNPNRFMLYKGLELKKLDHTLGRMRKSIPYVVGCLALAMGLSMMEGNNAYTELYGEHRNGGDWLTLYSRNSDADMSYNREFQRNRYLSESPVQTKNYLNSEEHLANLGIMKVNLPRTKGFDKRAPHPKYYY